MIDILAQAAETGEVGRNAMYITIATLIATTVTLIVKSIIESKERQRDRDMLREVKATGEKAKATGDLNHGMLNSQKSEMSAELKAVREEFKSFREQSVKDDSALKDQIRELTTSRDFARDTAKATPEPKKDT